MPNQETVILFTRYPVAGTSKTRLIPMLGPDGAADLHRRMTADILAELRQGQERARFAVEICYTGGTLELMQGWLGTETCYRRQSDGDLGDRMSAALSVHHRLGRSVCLVGSDCPALRCAILDEAFTALLHHDTVLGPSHDGGYYLIGCRPSLGEAVIPSFFDGIRWGGDRVYEETRKRIAAAGASCHRLPTLHDIDTPEDLRHLGHHPDPR